LQLARQARILLCATELVPAGSPMRSCGPMTMVEPNAVVEPKVSGRHPSRRLLLALTLATTLLGCAAERRIVAFGDVHGDLTATRTVLREAGAIDDSDRWVGGDLVVVQTGDQLDRGDDEPEILQLFERLRVEAAEAGGAFHALNGNHEIMNASGDFRYVTEEGFADFADAANGTDGDSLLAALEPHERGRAAAFRPGGPFALLLAQRDVILQIEDNVFVHGGVLPEHATYGIDRINDESREWLRGAAPFPVILDGSDSPEWTRLYSSEPDSTACATLQQTLDRLGARRMVVGHTVQREGIASACGEAVWRIDVGMARHYGGPVQWLEIVGDSVRARAAVN
jgi:hypothetical protein